MRLYPKLRLPSLFVGLAFAVVLGACGGDGGGGSDAAPTTASTTGSGADASAPGGVQTGQVPIKDFKFLPDVANVKVGSTVTWTNQDGFAHSVVADDKSFRSPNFDKGGSFTHKFETPGRFSYVCGIHNYMTGTIVVS